MATKAKPDTKNRNAVEITDPREHDHPVSAAVHEAMHARHGWERLGAASGIGFVLCALAATFVVPQPPQGGDSIAEVTEFFTDHRVRILTSVYLVGGAVALLLWFIGSIRAELRHANDRLAAIAQGGGIATAAMAAVTFAYPAALAGGIAANGDADTVGALFKLMGTTQMLGFFPIAVFLGASALVMIRWGIVSRVLGWCGAALSLAALAAAGGLYADTGAMAQNGELGFAVFLAFLAWVLAASIMLVARPPHDSRVRTKAASHA